MTKSRPQYNVRFSDEESKLIDLASDILGQPKAEFIRVSVVSEAKKTIDLRHKVLTIEEEST